MVAKIPSPYKACATLHLTSTHYFALALGLTCHTTSALEVVIRVSTTSWSPGLMVVASLGAFLLALFNLRFFIIFVISAGPFLLRLPGNWINFKIYCCLLFTTVCSRYLDLQCDTKMHARVSTQIFKLYKYYKMNGTLLFHTHTLFLFRQEKPRKIFR